MSTADINRRIENLIQLARVAQVDTDAARCEVVAGDIHTAPLPWLTRRAGDSADWWAPSVGEQVVLLAPGGNLGRAIVLPAIYSDAHPAPAQASSVRSVHYADGAVVSYDSAQHQLLAVLPSGGKAAITAPDGVHITGDTTITGRLHVSDKSQFDADMACSAKLTADTDVVGGGISLKNHKHKGVESGSSVSGPPKS